MKIFLIYTLIAIALVINSQCGPNDDNVEVMKILNEINDVIREHYQVKRRNVNLSAKSKAEADLLDDIKFTEKQARHILNGMKRQFGYEYDESARIYPDVNGSYWDFPVRFAFKGEHSESEMQVIRDGFQLWADNTCVTFEEHENKTELEGSPHLLIIRGSGCYSQIGVQSSNGQDLSIGDRCDRIGTVAHEVGHALGLWHEFSRPDRDDHVKVIWENIMDGLEYNFFINEPKWDEDPENIGYDISSLMHYDSLGFSIDWDNKLRVMMPLDIHQLTAMGQRARLQFTDIKEVNYAYDCVAQCSSVTLELPCKNGGYQDPKDCTKCRCPPGTAGVDCSQLPGGTGPDMSACGGHFYVEPCSIRTIALPTYPQAYDFESDCAWRITTNAKGLMVGFQERPDMPCSHADVCYDFVEVKTNLAKFEAPGRL